MNRHVKAIGEQALRWTGATSISRALHRHHLLVLAYHNIVPHGEPIVGDRSLHLEQREFARQLDWIDRTYDVVPLTAIFNAQETHGRPRAAITFDDAYRGAVTAGVTELVDRDMPATIFVAPGFVGGHSFWWDLVVTEGHGRPSGGIRDYFLDALEGRHDRVIAWAKDNGFAIRPVPHHQTTATEGELATCLTAGRVTLGSHTWSHPNLSHLHSFSDLEKELGKPLAWLRARFEKVVPWLAYPYGVGTNETAAAAKQTGYDGALLVSGGPFMPTKLERRRFMIPRLNVPSGLSVEGLALRSSGIVR